MCSKKVIIWLTLSGVGLSIVLAGVLIFQAMQKSAPGEEISGAYETLSLFGYQRAYPNKNIPKDAYFKAFQYSKQALRKTLSRTVAEEPWETMGPHNMAGRSLAVVFNPQNPNTIYTGSASGGLWRSYSGGVGASAWEYIPTGFPVLAVSSIAIAPDDSNTMYIGTGEVYNYQAAGTGAAYRVTRGTYGIGILKTTDGGATWDLSLDWSYNQQRGIWAIKFNPLNPNTLWAGTTEGTYKSMDAGATWQQVHDVVMVNDLVINPLDTNQVIVGCGNIYSEGHGLYRTLDGGATWTKLTVGLPETFGGKILLAVAECSPNIVYASIGNGWGQANATWLCLSIDFGDTWSVATTEDYSLWQGWFSHDVAVDPTDFATVILVGVDIWKSTAMGIAPEQKSNWIPMGAGQIPPGAPEGPPNYSHADHHDLAFHPTDANIIYFATDGGIFRSLDKGETFESCNGGLQTVQFYNGFSCSQQDSFLAMGGLQDNGTIIYRGSTAWDRQVLGGDGCWTGIDALNDSIVYASYQYLALFRFDDRGRHPHRIAPPTTNGYTCFVAPFVLGIDNPAVIYAGRDVVFKSTDRGEHWQRTNNGAPLDDNPVFVMAISHQNSDIVYAATSPTEIPWGMYRTMNGGENWENITADLPDRFPGDIAVDPTNDANVYLVLLGFGSSHCFKSADHGTTWEDIGLGLPDVPTSAIVVDPKYPNHLYVGNDLGVYVSIDGGTTWEAFNDGVPEAVIAMDLVISPSNRKLRVATHGNGAYERQLLEDVPTSLSEQTATPATFALEQNYPNPFNAATRITYSLAQASPVTLKIYNQLGQLVKVLLNTPELAAGRYEIRWNGTNDNGVTVATGTYIYRLQAGDVTLSRKMNFVK